MVPAIPRSISWHRRVRATLLLALGTMSFAMSAPADPTSSIPPTQETKMQHATGEFDVKITPQPLSGPAEDATLGRLAIEKEFRGDLTGSGKGQMLTAGTEVEGSAVYVAIERVSATLAGRSGSFALHHRGIMTRGEPELSVQVVPDSGTGELAGIEGTLHILIEGKKHRYDFEYALPAPGK